MAFQKDYGPLQISESGGNVSIAIDDSVSAGGGSVKGFISASGQGQAQVSGAVLADAGLAWLKGKFPAGAIAIDTLQAIVDEELAKL